MADRLDLRSKANLHPQGLSWQRDLHIAGGLGLRRRRLARRHTRPLDWFTDGRVAERVKLGEILNQVPATFRLAG